MWACKAVAIGHPFCSLTLILLLVIVSLFACTMMEAQSLAESNAREVGGPAESSPTNSSTNRSAVQDEHWNMPAAQKDASSEAGTHQVNGNRQDGLDPLLASRRRHGSCQSTPLRSPHSDNPCHVGSAIPL
jgi:hypothetical protein